MTKTIKILTLFIITITLFINTTYAETTNIYNDISNSTSNEIDPFENEEISNSSTTPTPVNAQISTISSIPEANLGLNNVLCIILISIGILILLLAIAILIRLH